MKTYIFILLLLLVSCEKNKEHFSAAGLILTRSATEFSNALMDNGSDPFNFKEFHIKGDSAFLTVSYRGGCKNHSFNIIWGESFIKTYPPQIEILIMHFASGDSCEGLITETLSFDLTELTGPVDYEKIIVNVLNGSSLQSLRLNDAWNPSKINVYNVIFPEGDHCQVEVKAGYVVCGAGLWDNLWFAMNDSVSAGVEGTYFKKWLQPVALSNNLKGFKPVPGKKYLLGANVQRMHPYLNVAVCLAFPGPSVPVKINCVTELN